MPKVLRIKNWANLYENNRSRELRHLDWVPIPNRMDSDDYTFLVSRPDGAACLGAWWAIVCIASRCDVRGTLLRSNGEPHTPHSLARMSHLPATLFEQTIPLFLSAPWMEEIDVDSITCKIPHDDATIPHDDATIPHSPAILARAQRRERKGTEGNGRERNTGVFLNSESAPLLDLSPPATQEEKLRWAQTALHGYIESCAGHACQIWPPPDTDLCRQFLEATNGAHLELVEHFLKELRKSEQQPEKNYAWFVYMAKKTFQPLKMEKAGHSLPAIP